MSRATRNWDVNTRRKSRGKEKTELPLRKPDGEKFAAKRSKSGTIKTLPESEMSPMTYALRMARGGVPKRKPSLPKFSWDREDGE